MLKSSKVRKAQLKRATLSAYAPNGCVNVFAEDIITARNGHVKIKGLYVDKGGNYYDSLFNLIEITNGQIVGNEKKNFYHNNKLVEKELRIKNRVSSTNSKNVGCITVKGNLTIK